MSAPCPEYGFVLRCRLVAVANGDPHAALRAAFADALEAHGLVAAGGGESDWRYVIRRDGGQAVDADRQAVAAWLATRREVADVVVGPLVDLTEPD
jgi:uncharacterized protein YggL (DUF469 family)